MASMMSSPKFFGWEVMKRTQATPGIGRDRVEERRRSRRPDVRVAIGVDVLAEELDLHSAGRDSRPDLTDDVRQRPEFLAAARKGHDAVGAEIVAALHDRDERAPGRIPDGRLRSDLPPVPAELRPDDRRFGGPADRSRGDRGSSPGRRRSRRTAACAMSSAWRTWATQPATPRRKGLFFLSRERRPR